MPKELTTKEAAARLGVCRSRINQLIEEERLPARKQGRSWIIDEADLVLVAIRKPGNPYKNKKAIKKRY